MSELLSYKNIGSTGKTFFMDVFNGDLKLGQIKWYMPWRRYCFYPANGTLFDRNCLTEIVNKLDGLMQERKQ